MPHKYMTQLDYDGMDGNALSYMIQRNLMQYYYHFPIVNIHSAFGYQFFIQN